jgi:hypothetical protein
MRGLAHNNAVIFIYSHHGVLGHDINITLTPISAALAGRLLSIEEKIV